MPFEKCSQLLLIVYSDVWSSVLIFVEVEIDLYQWLCTYTVCIVIDPDMQNYTQIIGVYATRQWKIFQQCMDECLWIFIKNIGSMASETCGLSGVRVINVCIHPSHTHKWVIVEPRIYHLHPLWINAKTDDDVICYFIRVLITC